jgi:hypothetical protein
MILDEAKAYVRVPAKIAIDFLRNSRIGVPWNGLYQAAQRFGSALKVGEQTAAIFSLILVCTRISVVHAVPQGVVE